MRHALFKSETFRGKPLGLEEIVQCDFGAYDAAVDVALHSATGDQRRHEPLARFGGLPEQFDSSRELVALFFGH